MLLIDRNEKPKGLALPGGFLKVEPSKTERSAAIEALAPGEVDESLEACARRVLLEETGASPREIHQLRAYGNANRDRRGRYVSVAYWTFVHESRCDPYAGKRVGSVRWVPLAEACSLKLAFDHNTILEDAQNLISQRRSELELFLDLMPDVFTFPQFWAAYKNAVDGAPADRSNLYKKAVPLFSPGELTQSAQIPKRGVGKPPKHYSLSRILGALAAPQPSKPAPKKPAGPK